MIIIIIMMMIIIIIMIIIIYIYRYEDTWHIYEDWILYSFSWPLASGGHGIDKVQPKIIVNAGVLFTRLEMMRPMSGTCQEFDAADHLEEELRCLAEYGGTQLCMCSTIVPQMRLCCMTFFCVTLPFMLWVCHDLLSCVSKVWCPLVLRLAWNHPCFPLFSFFWRVPGPGTSRKNILFFLQILGFV
jgi:hypothetical protein